MEYQFEVSTNAYVFLHRRGGECVNLDDLVRCFSKSVARIRLNMQDECLLTQEKLKKRVQQVQQKVWNDDSSSNIEFVEGGSTVRKRCHAKQEPDMVECHPRHASD